MLNRKSTSPYFIYSFFIHLILLLVMWWIVPQQVQLQPFHEEIEALITHVERPLQPKPLPVIEPAALVVVEEAKSPPPKPKAGLSTAWQMEDTNAVDIRKPETRKQEGSRHSRESIGNDLLSNPVVGNPINYRAENRVAVNSADRAMLALRTPETNYVAPQGETKPIDLGANDALSGGSPTVDAPKIHYGSQRGDALRAAGVGNSWGGGGSAGGANVGGAFVYMMKELARTLVEATTRKKVDVVFVLDETESMWDNIRGIRAYIDFLFEAFERESRDATFGLVTFTDSIRTYGHTDDLGTFKNWIFDIGVAGGGDFTEAGLDALMTVGQETKFRRGAQRLVVFASDAAFHDADYDGRSPYSLDQVIEVLQSKQIRVDVIGIDYLPVRQIALATRGTWRAIPGRGELEYVPPLTLTVKLFSKLGTLRLEGERIDDKITVYINNPPRPQELTLTWKVLNPLGERVYGPFTEKKIIPDDGATEIELTPAIDTELLLTMPGIYTIIYRLENEHGHQSILRRTLMF